MTPDVSPSNFSIHRFTLMDSKFLHHFLYFRHFFTALYKFSPLSIKKNSDLWTWNVICYISVIFTKSILKCQNDLIIIKNSIHLNYEFLTWYIKKVEFYSGLIEWVITSLFCSLPNYKSDVFFWRNCFSWALPGY